MATSKQNIFSAKALGGSKQINPVQTMIYACSNPGLMFALVYLMWAPFLYPGAHMVWAVATVVQMFIIAGMYWLMSCAMPRTGGEYIYISRILHPSLGLLSSFMISITSISWTGCLTDWFLKWSLADFFQGLAFLTGSGVGADRVPNPKWMQVYDFFMITHVRAVLGLLILALILYIYYKGVTWMVKVSTITLVVTIIGVIVFLYATFTNGVDNFSQNWTQYTGVDYNAVIPEVSKMGFSVEFMVMPTIMAGSTYVILNTLGSTFGANLAGEVRDVQKSSLLSLFGSLAILMAMWAFFYGLSYASFGDMWTNCLMILYNSGSELYPFQGDPFLTLTIGILTGSPIFTFLIAVIFAISTFGAAAGLGFGPTRNFIAWANDKMLPASFAKPNAKTKAPMTTMRTVIGIAAIFLLMDIYAPDWTANIAYTIFTWFMGWILLGIAGIVFPYRKKVLFESAPPIVKTKILGIPLMTILGVLVTIISTAICIYLLIPFFNGDLPPTMIIVSFGIAVICLIIYFASRASNKKHNVETKYQFMEIPYE